VEAETSENSRLWRLMEVDAMTILMTMATTMVLEAALMPQLQ